MANGDYGTQYTFGISLGYQEGANVGLRYPLTVDFSSITASQVRAYTVDGGTLFVAPYPSTTGYGALITISLATAIGRQWRVLPFGSGYVTQARLDDGRTWGLVIVSTADTSQANYRTIQADVPITVVETGVLGYRALLVQSPDDFTGTPRVIPFFGGRAAFGSGLLVRAGGGVTPPAAPNITAPSADAVLTTLTPQVTWDAVSGATLYRVQYGQASDFSGATEATTTNANYTLPTLTKSGRQYFRVRAENAGGNSAWTSVSYIVEYQTFELNTSGASVLAYWTLRETSGTVADNAEGTAARDGTYDAGVALANIAFDNQTSAPLFDGTTTDEVNIYSASLAGVFNGNTGTLTVWAKIGAAEWIDAAARTLARISADNSNYWMITKSATNNTLIFEHRGNGGGLVIKTVTYTVPVGDRPNWLRLDMTVASGNVKAFVNGAQVGTTQTGAGTFTGALVSNGCYVGGVNALTTQKFLGHLAHVVARDAAIDASIAGLYSAANPI